MFSVAVCKWVALWWPLVHGRPGGWRGDQTPVSTVAGCPVESAAGDIGPGCCHVCERAVRARRVTRGGSRTRGMDGGMKEDVCGVAATGGQGGCAVGVEIMEAHHHGLGLVHAEHLSGVARTGTEVGKGERIRERGFSS